MPSTFEDLLLIDRLHGGFPISDRPFEEIARDLGCSEADVLERLDRLMTDGLLTRFGPLFQIERAGGQFVLAALSAPEERFADITRCVNAFPEVAHNYRREHPLNMWFVVAAETPEDACKVIAQIEEQSGCPVFAFPKEREFFVELRLPLMGGTL